MRKQIGIYTNPWELKQFSYYLMFLSDAGQFINVI